MGWSTCPSCRGSTSITRARSSPFARVGEGVEGLVHISELSDQHVESPEQVVQVGEQVRVKVVDVDVSRRRISLSTRRVAEEPEVLSEPEVEAEPTAQVAADVAPEPSAETRGALGEAEARGDESSQEAFEATIEPEPEAPEEAAMHPVPEAEVPEEPATTPEEEEDVSLEAIVEELKRREGRG